MTRPPSSRPPSSSPPAPAAASARPPSAPPPDPPPDPAARPRRSRDQRSAENRRALLRAAAEVVGEFGYRDASIARITQRAGVAQGTFYLYFSSRQELFDQLLPSFGAEMMDALARGARGADDVLALEEAGFRNFFSFIDRNPAFLRVLNEAETAAPAAFRLHFDRLVDSYTRSLERSAARGELPGYEPRELEVLAYVLMAARAYLYLRYGKGPDGPGPVPEWVIGAVMKFVAGGLRQGRDGNGAGPQASPADDGANGRGDGGEPPAGAGPRG